MTLDEFILKYNNQQVEVTGSANARFQCVDLVNAYLREVLNQPIIAGADAKDFPERMSSEWDFIENLPNSIALRGDMAVWDAPTGDGHGHIAIILNANLKNTNTFDQNWSKPLRSSLENHSYLNPKIWGWLRLRTAGNQGELNQCLADKASEIRQKEELSRNLKIHEERIAKIRQLIN